MPPEPGFPKMMMHPGYRPAVLSQGAANSAEQGRPVMWPPITVYTSDQEQKARADGYHLPGEQEKPMAEHIEYPLMMTHPQYQPELPAETIARRENGELIMSKIPGQPAKFPPVTVGNPDEESAWRAKGYERPGRTDAAAFVTAHAAPELQQPGHATVEYPKYLAKFDRTVNSMAEELALTNPGAKPVVIVEPSSDQSELLARLAALEAENAELKQKRKGGRPKKTKTEEAQAAAD